MHFRRTGQRDERRRRVLMEDRAATGLDEDVAAESSVDEEHASEERNEARYSRDVLSTGQPRITDLIPTRRRVLWAVGLAGLLQIAAIGGLYQFSLLRPESAAPQLPLAVLNPLTAGSLGAVLASLMVGSMTLACCLVYAVRRHKVDDYRGEYRWWIWVALALGAVSLDACTHISDPLGVLAAHFSGLSVSPRWLTLGTYYVAGGLLGLWFFVEFRRSAAATGLLLAGLASLIVAGAWHSGWQWRPQLEAVHSQLWLPIAYLLGTQCLALSVWTFARRVRLEAEGQLPAVAVVRSRLWQTGAGRSGSKVAPVADEPVADEPVADSPVADNPIADNPVADNPVADNPVADNPIADNPVAALDSATSSTKKTSAKKKAVSTAATPKKAARQLRRDAAHQTDADDDGADESSRGGRKSEKKPATRTKTARAAANPEPNTDDEQISPSDPEWEGLSRSERRRLRKLQRRQRT